MANWQVRADRQSNSFNNSENTNNISYKKNFEIYIKVYEKHYSIKTQQF